MCVRTAVYQPGGFMFDFQTWFSFQGPGQLAQAPRAPQVPVESIRTRGIGKAMGQRG